LKRPMMPSGEPLQFGQAETATDFEMNLDQLSSDLNAMDLDVQILQMSIGPIDPTITHMIEDKEGKQKEIMSNAPRGMGADPSGKKKVYRGLRMITERRIGDANQNQIREKFPNYHIVGPLKSKLAGDSALLEKYPDAVEYYFSPKQELMESQRAKNPGSVPMYGESRRTTQQYERFMEEAQSEGLLDENNKVDREKFTKKLKSMGSKVKLSLDERNVVNRMVAPQLRQFLAPAILFDKKYPIPTGEINTLAEKYARQMMDAVREKAPYEKYVQEEIMSFLNDERAMNSLLGEYAGTATTLDRLFKQRVLGTALKTIENRIPDMIKKGKESKDWPQVQQEVFRYADKAMQDKSRREPNRRRKFGTARGGPRVKKSWIEIIKNEKKKPIESTMGYNEERKKFHKRRQEKARRKAEMDKKKQTGLFEFK